MSQQKKLYFAGPLFSQAELSFNAHLAEQIENLGYNVYLPQRDGFKSDGKQPVDTKEGRCKIFNRDRDNVLASDILLFILDGRVPDEGACVELGIAYAHKLLQAPKKKIIGLHTDIRGAFTNALLNPMLEAAFNDIVVSVDELLSLLK